MHKKILSRLYVRAVGYGRLLSLSQFSFTMCGRRSYLPLLVLTFVSQVLDFFQPPVPAPFSTAILSLKPEQSMRTVSDSERAQPSALRR